MLSSVFKRELLDAFQFNSTAFMRQLNGMGFGFVLGTNKKRWKAAVRSNVILMKFLLNEKIKTHFKNGTAL